MIPSLLHFIWIQKKQFGRQEYLVIKSALKNTFYQIFLHTNLKPDEAVFCPYSLNHERLTIKYQEFSLIHKGIEIRAATLTDILRIKILQEYGGIYSDMDMLWFKPIPLDLTNISLFATWENQSYKILTNCILGSAKGFDFSLLLKKFDLIFDSLLSKNITNISGNTLKEHLTLFKSTGDFFKEKSDIILKRKYFGKNTWRVLHKFLTNQISQDKIIVKDICGIHLCGCGLFGDFQTDTSLLIYKHSILRSYCDNLLNEIPES